MSLASAPMVSPPQPDAIGRLDFWRRMACRVSGALGHESQNSIDRCAAQST